METFEQAQTRIAELQSGERVERPIAEHGGWKFGERVVVIEDEDSSMGPFAGEEGVLVIQEVGAVEYDNLRIDMSIIVDGTDCPADVSPANIESINHG